MQEVATHTSHLARAVAVLSPAKSSQRLLWLDGRWLHGAPAVTAPQERRDSRLPSRSPLVLAQEQVPDVSRVKQQNAKAEHHLQACSTRSKRHRYRLHQRRDPKNREDIEDVRVG